MERWQKTLEYAKEWMKWVRISDIINHIPIKSMCLTLFQTKTIQMRLFLSWTFTTQMIEAKYTLKCSNEYEHTRSHYVNCKRFAVYYTYYVLCWMLSID